MYAHANMFYLHVPQLITFYMYKQTKIYSICVSRLASDDIEFFCSCETTVTIEKMTQM